MARRAPNQTEMAMDRLPKASLNRESIGEMLAFQAYNIQSPLDAEAAMWADLNKASLPLDTRNLHPPEI